MKRLIYGFTAFAGFMAVAMPALAANEIITIHTCPLCGICSSPFGFCIFPFIIAALLIAILILALTGTGKRCPLCHAKCKKDAYLCHKCGYDFESRLQSTMAIRIEDSPELMALRAASKDLSEHTAEFSVDELNARLAEKEAAEAKNGVEMKHCPICGAELPKVAMFCGKCGRRLDE